METNTTLSYLQVHGIKPSLQRMAVMTYLIEHHTHPTAERNCCFDADTSPHAHFLCTRCGHVYDMKLSQAELIKCTCVPDNFQTENVQLHLRGCCPKCAAQNKDN